MVTATHVADDGWTELRETDVEALEISPAAMVLHYGQSIFDGVRAFPQPDGAMALFRPRDSAARFRRSAERLAFPQAPEELFVEACERAVRANGGAMTSQADTSLYLRTLLIGVDRDLGVHPASRCELTVTATPVPPGAAEQDPLRVWVSRDLVRSTSGGTGGIKCAGNYATSFLPLQRARAAGCDDVLFLGPERRLVEGLTGTNVCFVEGEGAAARLVTPAQTGSMVEGLTRDTLLRLAPDLGLDVVERPLPLDDVLEGIGAGGITEVLATGTVAGVRPVAELSVGEQQLVVGDGGAGPWTRRLADALADVQRGRAGDGDGWRHRVD